MSNAFKTLIKTGYTNLGSEAWENMLVAQEDQAVHDLRKRTNIGKVYKGYCTSEPCCIYHKNMKRLKKDGIPMRNSYMREKVFKTDDKTKTNCVDCGSALFWQGE